MGLDVVVCTKVELTDEHERDPDSCWDAGHRTAYTLKGQQHALGGLIEGREYASIGDEWGFRAGSYSGYGAYRNALCMAAHDIPIEELWARCDEFAGKPFYEQLNFADNEGTIGPTVAEKLARDYGDESVYAKMIDAGFKEVYEQWARAFRDASGDGMVVFC